MTSTNVRQHPSSRLGAGVLTSMLAFVGVQGAMLGDTGAEDELTVRPVKLRLSDQVIEEDKRVFRHIRSSIDKARSQARKDEACSLIKAEAWLNVAEEEYDENEEGAIVEATIRESQRLLRVRREAADHQQGSLRLVGGSKEARPDLWARLDEFRARGPSCGCAELAKLEVQLTWVDHEAQESLDHARSYIEAAERLAEAARQEVDRACPARMTALSAGLMEEMTMPTSDLETLSSDEPSTDEVSQVVQDVGLSPAERFLPAQPDGPASTSLELPIPSDPIAAFNPSSADGITSVPSFSTMDENSDAHPSSPVTSPPETIQRESQITMEEARLDVRGEPRSYAALTVPEPVAADQSLAAADLMQGSDSIKMTDSEPAAIVPEPAMVADPTGASAAPSASQPDEVIHAPSASAFTPVNITTFERTPETSEGSATERELLGSPSASGRPVILDSTFVPEQLAAPEHLRQSDSAQLAEPSEVPGSAAATESPPSVEPSAPASLFAVQSLESMGLSGDVGAADQKTSGDPPAFADSESPLNRATIPLLDSESHKKRSEHAPRHLQNKAMAGSMPSGETEWYQSGGKTGESGTLTVRERSSASAEDSTPDSPLVAESITVLTRSNDGLSNVPHAVHFATGSAAISPLTAKALDKTREALLRHPEALVRLEGHADRRGRSSYNDRLSNLRTKAVMAYLIRGGIDPERIVTVAFGESRPLTEGHRDHDLAKNRRVAIVVTNGERIAPETHERDLQLDRGNSATRHYMFETRKRSPPIAKVKRRFSDRIR